MRRDPFAESVGFAVAAAPFGLRNSADFLPAIAGGMALSAGYMLTKYLNQIFVVTREVRNPVTGAVDVAADYSELGLLLIAVSVIGVVMSLGVIMTTQRSRFRIEQ